MRPPPVDGLLGGRGQEADRHPAPEQVVLHDLDPELVPRQDEVGGDPAPSAVDRVPLKGLADKPGGDRDGVGLPGDRLVEQVRLRAERLGDRPPLAGLGAGEDRHGVAGAGRAALRVGDHEDPAVARDRGRLALVVEPVGLGEDHFGRVLVLRRVVLAGANPTFDDVVFDHVAGPSLGDDQEPPGLARRPLVAGLVADQGHVMRIAAREQFEAEGVRQRPFIAVLGDRPRPAREVDRPPLSVFFSIRPLDAVTTRIRCVASSQFDEEGGPWRSSRLRVILNLGSCWPLSRLSVVPITAGPKLTSRSQRNAPSNRTAKPSRVVPPAWILIAAVQGGWSEPWLNLIVPRPLHQPRGPAWAGPEDSRADKSLLKG